MLAYGCAWVRAASRWLRHPLTHSARGGVLKVSGRGTSFFLPASGRSNKERNRLGEEVDNYA